MSIDKVVGHSEKTSSKKVLIIDDLKQKREYMAESLEESGYEVHEAYDGQDGLDKFVPNKYLVVVCDQEMPKILGERVIPEIKRRSPNQPVIMFSTRVGRFSDEKKTAIGADEYLNPDDRGNMYTRLIEAVQRVER